METLDILEFSRHCYLSLLSHSQDNEGDTAKWF